MAFKELIESKRLAIPHYFIPEILKSAENENTRAYQRGAEDMYQKALTVMFSLMAGGRWEQNMTFLKNAVAELKARTSEEISQRLAVKDRVVENANG